MNALNKQVAALVTIIFTVLPIAAATAATISAGGSDGGGGFQYPNAKLLLKVVSVPLAKSIETMDDKAFQNFPSNLRRTELAKIIRSVISMPDVQRERMNADGESEGLMFDYDRNYCDQKGCGPRIIALKPFFDAYKGLPVTQLEKQLKQEPVYRLTLDDVRQRLVHEAAHLLGVGITAATDAQADVFYERLIKVANNQFLFCAAPDWRKSVTSGRTEEIYEAFLVHLQTGTIGYTFNLVYPNTNRDESKAYSIDLLKRAVANNSADDFNPYPKPSNFIRHMQAETYSIGDGILTWEGHAYQDFPEDRPTARIDLRSGIGQLTMSGEIDWDKRKIQNYVTARVNCHIETSVIDMKF